MKHLILATAGHVDHGKSALVKALTGVDPDRLPEEKARGITIDLGFAEIALTAEDGGEPAHLGLIDVPGHEDFVKNMVAGVGSVDLALLVVAVDDGWMPQTEEHLQILTYLGVARGVVALTKADLASDLAPVVRAVRARLQESPFAEAPIEPVSIFDTASLSRLRRTLAGVCGSTPPPREIGKPRLAVDRAFSMSGVGTVVTGTLTGGCLKRGDAAAIQPAGIRTRIRSMQSHGREIEAAGPGQRVALQLADLPVAADRRSAGVRRGHVVTAPDAGVPSQRLDVLLECSKRVPQTGGRPTIRSGCIVRVHLGAASAHGRVRLLDEQEFPVGASALARLTLDQPLFAMVGDRFIVRDSAGRRTLAGGIVLDPAPPENIDHQQRTYLHTRMEAPLDLESAIRAELARASVCNADALLSQSRWSREEIAAALSRMASTAAVVRTGPLVIDSTWWTSLVQRAAAAIDSEHKAHPDRSGIDLAQLRTALGACSPSAAEALVAHLCRNGFTQAGSCIRRNSHQPSLPQAIQVIGARLRAALDANPLEPPARKLLAPDSASAQVLRYLLQTGEAVEVGPELVMNAAALDHARERVREHIRAKGPSATSELRQALGTNRRVIVPLLEHLDREGLTRRIGDKRVLRSP